MCFAAGLAADFAVALVAFAEGFAADFADGFAADLGEAFRALGKARFVIGFFFAEGRRALFAGNPTTEGIFEGDSAAAARGGLPCFRFLATVSFRSFAFLGERVKTSSMDESSASAN